MVIKAQVTPEVLVWARESAGYSVEEIAAKISQKRVSPTTIENWEKGEDRPTYAQLEKLAAYYKRPIAVFYFPSPPEEESINQKFRSLPEAYSSALSPRMRYLVRKASAQQINLRELHGLNLPEPITAFSKHFQPFNLQQTKQLARRAREFIGIELGEQFQWENSDEALKQWRKALESRGIWIFKDAFRDDKYSGFCLNDPHFPLIYLNNSMAKQRQIFTLFHELAHLISGKGGIDFRTNMEETLTGNYKQEEVLCNAFAAELLVPDESLELSGKPDDADIKNYAEKYKVSRELILRKYFNRNLIDQRFYDEKVKNWEDDWLNTQKQKKEKGGGGNYYATQNSYLGDKYLKLVFAQHYRGKLSEYEVADYLGVKIKSLGTLEGYMHQGSED